MGSSKNPYERLMKLMSSALKLVTEGSRSAESLADHLQVFVFGQFRKVTVNYHDPAYRRIDRDQYAFVNAGLRPEHFPVRSNGQVEVIYDYLEYDHEPSIEEVLNDIERRGNIRVPDFAETLAYHKANPEERMKAPVISLCGSIERRLGPRAVACVSASGFGIRLFWRWLHFRCGQSCRFLVVCK